MNTISVKEALAIMNNGKFFTIHGYVKVDKTVTSINARQGVNKYRSDRTGGWTGNHEKHVMICKPVRANESKEVYKGFRNLRKEQLVGCTLKANGTVYKIVDKD